MPTSAVSPVGTPTGAAQTSQPKTDRGLSTLRSEDFFKIMISELREQDPLAPAKTSDMISQVSQIRSIELSGQLTDTLNQIAATQRTAGASDLLGKFVSATTTDANGQASTTEGVVTGVRYGSDGSAILDLDNGGQVAASAVTLVTTLDEHEKMTHSGSSPNAVTGAASKLAANGAKELGLSTATGAQGGSRAARWLNRLFQA